MVKVFIIINLFVFASAGQFIRFEWRDGGVKPTKRLIFNHADYIVVSRTKKCIADNGVKVANCLSLRRTLREGRGGRFTTWYLHPNGDLLTQEIGRGGYKKYPWCEEEEDDFDSMTRSLSNLDPNLEDDRECSAIEEIEENPDGKPVHSIRVDFMRKGLYKSEEEEATIQFNFDEDGLLVSVDRQ